MRRSLPTDIPPGVIDVLIPLLDGDVDELVLDEPLLDDLVAEALEESLCFGSVNVRIADGAIHGEARSLLLRSPRVVLTPVLDDGRIVLNVESNLPVRGAVAKAQRRCDAITRVLGDQGRRLDRLDVEEGRVVVAVVPAAALSA